MFNFLIKSVKECVITITYRQLAHKIVNLSSKLSHISTFLIQNENQIREKLFLTLAVDLC